jgi:hypothetical protein
MILPNDSDAESAREKLAGDCGMMKNLLHGLLDSSGRVADEVHAIRKLGKSLRGGFGLFGLGKSAAAEIQAIGRLLSEPRDAVSRLKTWNKLAWNEDVLVAAAIGGLLEQHTHSAARRPPQETIAWCQQRVDHAMRDLGGLPVEGLARTIGTGLSKLEKKVLKRCRRLDHREEEDFHEARKAVKAWLGAVGFLPEGLVSSCKALEGIAEMLGDENDLATLSEWLEAHGFTRRFVPGLRAAVDSARRKLQKQVIKEAAGLPSQLV